MLGRVLDALASAQTIDRIAVVTPEPDALPPNVLVLPDPGGGLNAALTMARDTLVKLGARELVILPTDLPLVTSGDVDLLVTRGRKTGFALASDVPGVGTNALYLSPPEPFRFQFGCDSRSQHLAEAARLGLATEIIQTPGLTSDLDDVEDLRRLRRAEILHFLQVNHRLQLGTNG
jgi:2-phospho-L-lactate guanylyltransferase